MFCKASLLTVALALLASATPVVRETGIRIPLSKRSSLTKADGTVDQDAVIRETVRTKKYVTSAACVMHPLTMDLTASTVVT